MMTLNQLLDVPEISVQEGTSADGLSHLKFKGTSSNYVTTLVYDQKAFDRRFWEKVANRIKSLVVNNVSFDSQVFHSESELLDFINQHYPKHTPAEKLFFVLEFIAKKAKYDGEQVMISEGVDLVQNQVWRRNYFENEAEFQFYLDTLVNSGKLSRAPHTAGWYLYALTVDGLDVLAEADEGVNSRYCFVAMSFDPTLQNIFTDAIEPALTETGYLPYIVSNVHLDSEATINDGIISGIKKAKFTIADFTQHKNGVYFEAGYALGRRQKVIYTCKKSDFQNTHFDTNHFQYILWDTTDELRNRLVEKINAFIKN